MSKKAVIKIEEQAFLYVHVDYFVGSLKKVVKRGLKSLKKQGGHW